jgi:CDP-diacylglycerol--serine O-phosphatidyltransferase
MDKTRMSYRALLADGLSLGNGSSGVVGVIVMLTWHDPRALAVACLFVFIAWGFDSIDGLAARGLERSPAEGAVLDSLCDTSSFAALPAALLTAYGARVDRSTLIISGIAGVVFFGCVVLRLRRYTVGAVGHTSEERTSFEGVPSPVAAMSVAASILAAITGPPALAWMPILFAAVTAPLMMSQIRYRDTPRLAAWLVRAKWPLPVLAAIAYVAGNIAVALSVFFAAYLASGALSRRQQARSEMGSECI